MLSLFCCVSDSLSYWLLQITSNKLQKHHSKYLRNSSIFEKDSVSSAQVGTRNVFVNLSECSNRLRSTCEIGGK